jgi:hypothetical protein
MILPDARTLPHDLAHWVAVAEQSAARGKDWIITHPIGTTQGQPRHDLWTKLR